MKPATPVTTMCSRRVVAMASGEKLVEEPRRRWRRPCGERVGGHLPAQPPEGPLGAGGVAERLVHALEQPGERLVRPDLLQPWLGGSGGAEQHDPSDLCRRA